MYTELFKLDDEFSIETDPLTFALKREYKDTKIWRRTGKEVTKTHEDRWFAPTLAGVLKLYVRETGRSINGLEDYMKKLEEIHETIKKFDRTYMIEERPIKLVG